MFPSSDFLSSTIIFSAIGPNIHHHHQNNYYNRRHRLYSSCLLLLYHSCHRMSTTPSSSSSSSSSNNTKQQQQQYHQLACDHHNGHFIDHNIDSSIHQTVFMNKIFEKFNKKLSHISTIMINIIKLIMKIIYSPSMILFILIIISYWPTFYAELVFDDRPAIIQNDDLRSSKTSWTQLWFNDYWGTPLKSTLSHKSYRPLTVLTFRINYIIHQLRPFGYHFVNILLHYFVTILFYRLCQRFYRFTSTSSVSGIKSSSSSILPSSTSWLQSTPFIMAALFAVHPIHTDCVCSIVGRAELLSAIFYLSSILLWDYSENSTSTITRTLKSFTNESNYNQDEKQSQLLSSYRWWCLWSQLQLFIDKYHRLLSIIMALFGFLCKEQAIFVLIYLAINHLFINNNNNNNNDYDHHHHHDNKIIRQRYQQQQQQRRRKHRSIFTSLSSSSSINYGSSSLPLMIIMTRTKLRIIIILAAVFIIATYIRFIMMDYSLPIFNRFDNPASRMPWPSRHLTYGYLILYHYWLMFYPQHLSCDWTHSSLNLIDYQSKSNRDNNDQYLYYRIMMVIVCFTTIIVYVYKWILLILRQQKQQQQQRYRYRNMLKASHHSIINDNINNKNNNDGKIFDNQFYMNDGNGHHNNQQYENQSMMTMMTMILLSLSLTIIPFIPVSNILFPVGFVLAERILYLPSIGFLLLFGFGIDYLLLFYNTFPFPLPSSSLLSSLFSLYKRRQTSSTRCDHNVVVGKEGEGTYCHQQPCHKSSACNVDSTTSHFYHTSLSSFVTNNENRNVKWKIHPIQIATIMLVVIFSAKTFLRSFDWTNEFALYESGLKVNPRNTKLLNNLGRLYETTTASTMKENSSEIAIELYRKAISIEPYDLRSYLNLGNIYHKHFNDTRLAEQIYRQALDQFDQQQYLQPSSLIEIDRLSLSPLYLTVLIRLTELLSLDSTRQNDLKIIQDKLIETQFLFDPLSLLATSSDQECNHRHNNNVLSSIQLDQLYNLGVVHYQQGRLKEAFNYFERVLSMNPNHVDTLLTSARIIQDEHLDQLKHIAYDRFDHLIRLGKDDESIYFNLATLAINNQHFARAKRLFEKAIAKRESFAEAHYNLALLLVKEMNPTTPNIGQQQQSLAQLHEAIDHLQRVLLINPKHMNSMFILAELYSEELRQYDRARYYYQLILDRIDRNNIQAKHNLCVLWHKQNNIDESIHCFEDLLQYLSSSSSSSSSSSQIIDKLSINYWQIIQEQITYLWRIKNQINQTTTKSIETGDYSTTTIVDQQHCKNVSTNSDMLRNHQHSSHHNHHHHYENYMSTMAKMCFI
nr:protein O-mannosyl-transferase Tmtc3-like [Dermatophagoides farinae]